ncbi:hypothetical protein ILUMI_12469 [Ignelater luminosus]|uniref:tRNA-5-taurinomethyluridine 2-sulfurtransferase n=1 Tax=Ignelater luminosus TaxID=2038154 RepID=A0A8K0CYD9_IGNLU|nr:hypothetical protein ILUMI_12469 [Ignelater luminosus]
MFPLGELTKPVVKKIAIENGLEQIARKKESMGICFIGSRNFQKFISEYVDNRPGNFIDVDTGKIVETHNGIHQWTLGQRTKISGCPVAYFTAKKNCNTNDIYVAQGTHHPALFSGLLYTSPPYWIHSRPKELEDGGIYDCDFKFQHVENFIPCKISETHKGLVVILQTNRRALTPGQFAVFYKNDECLGSAKIVNAGPSNFILHWLENNNLRNVSDLLVYKNKLFRHTNVKEIDNTKNEFHTGEDDISEKENNDVHEIKHKLEI